MPKAPRGLDAARRLLDRPNAAALRDMADLSFLPPIPDSDKFLCVGKNYRTHLEELKRTDLIREIPDQPTGFVKINSCLTGHDTEVERPPSVTHLDYEPETDHYAGSLDKRLGRAHQHGMFARQFFAGVRAVVDENNLRPSGHPKHAPGGRQITSATTGSKSIASPPLPCRWGSNARSMSLSVGSTATSLTISAASCSRCPPADAAVQRAAV
ncbi:MAG: hypothetical protein EXR28_05730 [Betaproteobacteria bacterium]|nr:hypothetical protein [Betaproteobacteria bacterium]